MRPQRKPTRQQRETTNRENMTARLRAERDRGWPSNGPWNEDTRGYVDLRAVDAARAAPGVTTDKTERKREGQDLFRQTGEVAR